MPRDTISKVTIRRRGKAERQMIQTEKDNERKAKNIEELTDIGTERSPARESFPTRKAKCIEFPPDYKSEPTSDPLRSCKLCCENKTDCVYELKDADGKCDHCHKYKMHCKNQPEITDFVPSKQRVLRHSLQSTQRHVTRAYYWVTKTNTRLSKYKSLVFQSSTDLASAVLYADYYVGF